MTSSLTNRCSFAALLTSGASALALSAPVLASDAATPQTEASDVIVVTATKTELTNFDYPGLTSAIVFEDLEEERPSDLTDLLQDIPGLQVAGGPRRTGQTISLRGFGRESVTLLVDGARQNFDSAHDGVLFLDPSLLGRVESVRGSAAALYGSGASGGVIAFETLEADDVLREGQSLGARASVGYRSVNEETRGSAAVFGDAGAFEGIAAISLRQSGDIALGSGGDLPADDEVFSNLLAGEWDINDAVELEAGLAQLPQRGGGAQ
jgi:hemoglobin/transferrin/lactoferrin receptor protein